MAEPLLLLPGLMADFRVFSHQIKAFGRERAIHLVPVSAATSVAVMAKEALENAPARFALAGHGLGAMVAMEILRQAPERVARIALLSCSPLAETPQDRAAREPRIVGAQAGRLAEIIQEEFPVTCLGPGPRRAAAAKKIADMAADLGGEIYLRQSRAMQRRPDQQKVLRTTRAPALILCGAHDTITPPRRHEFMAELMPSAELVVLEEAGHQPLLEAPEAVTAAMTHWLAAPYRLI